MACCAFAIYLLGRFLAGVDWVGARLPFLPKRLREPAPNLSAGWRPGSTPLAPVASISLNAPRRRVFGRAGVWLAAAAGLELAIVAGATLGWSLVSLVPNASPALLDAADTALSICRGLRALGPSF